MSTSAEPHVEKQGAPEAADLGTMTLPGILEAFASGELRAEEVVDPARGLVRVVVVEDPREDAAPDGLQRSSHLFCGDEAVQEATRLQDALRARFEWAREEGSMAPTCDEAAAFCWFPSVGEYGAGLRVEFADTRRIRAHLQYAADATLTGEYLEKLESEAFRLRDARLAQECP